MPNPTPASALADLMGHRFYRYRGCAPVPAPDADFPGQALGDPALSIDAWSATSEDGGEPQRERIQRERAAKAVCAACPVLAQCRAYAMAHTTDPETGAVHLAEEDGIWGGMLSLERHRALIALRQEQADTIPEPTVDAAAVKTVQKQRLLAALARETDEELVAYRAGMDVRTANWHRSQLCGLLRLDKEVATRQQLLDTAARHGLLPKGARIKPDGAWPLAAAPSTDGARQRRIAPGMPVQLVLPGYEHLPRGKRARVVPQAARATRPARRATRPRLTRLTAAPTALTDRTTPLETAA